MSKRGGNHGGGTTVRRVTLSIKAAQIVRNFGGYEAGERQRSDEASADASRLIEQITEGVLLSPSSLSIIMPWIEEARRTCTDELAGLELDRILRAARVAALEAKETGMWFLINDWRECSEAEAQAARQAGQPIGWTGRNDADEQVHWICEFDQNGEEQIRRGTGWYGPTN